MASINQNELPSSPVNTPPFEITAAHSGIDYALRTLQQSHVQLSLMADTKSNIMITVCSIVVSASLTQIHRAEFRDPLLVLDFFTLIALVAALLCVLPAKRAVARIDGEIDRSDPSFNPLFFMHFQHLSLDEFQRELESRLGDPGELYRSLTRDIYATGHVLANSKFRLLRISYVAFITGLIASLGLLAFQFYQRFA